MRKSKQVFILAALLFSFLCFPTDRVLAASNTVEVPLTVKQNFEQKGNEKEVDLAGNYQLRALDVDMPMPEDSQDDVYNFELKGAKAEKTISLNFLHGGVYRYQLVQTTKDKENYVYDRSSYNITVYVKNGEDGKLIPQVIAEKNDGKKYGKLEFQNFFNKESSKPSPSNPSGTNDPVKTGDSTNATMYMMIASGALLLIILLGYRKKDNQKNNRV